MRSSTSVVEVSPITSEKDWKVEAERLEKTGYAVQAADIRNDLKMKASNEIPVNTGEKRRSKKSKGKKRAPVAEKEKSVQKLREDYVRGAVNNIPENIMPILRHPTCSKLLYETRLPDGEILFDKISKNPSLIFDKIDLVLQMLELENGRTLLQRLRPHRMESNWHFKVLSNGV